MSMYCMGKITSTLYRYCSHYIVLKCFYMQSSVRRPEHSHFEIKILLASLVLLLVYFVISIFHEMK